MRSIGAIFVAVLFVATVIILIMAQEAKAYVDPGTTGMLSQILYVLFYGALGVFFYFLRSIKQYFANAKQFFAKFIGGRE